ncbi:histone acetyltransferases subunit 3-domain-containing protein [Flammula alnicola]|nr:histone acetyltransferases subunit 3-domain-containing protein [Flammula alnicola]
MASKLSSFHQPSVIGSSLLKNAPDAVPPIDELEKLQSELRSAKQKALERGRKAEEDLRTIEESMRRMTEKEKGKFKAIDKVKREPDFTPLPDADESRPSSSYLAGSSKSRNNSHPLNALPSSSRSSLDPRRSAADELRKKKKKRKREGGDSDVDSELQRPHKISPPAAHATPHVQPPKSTKPTISATVPHNKAQLQAGPDFSVPPAQQLLPPRPPIPTPPIPGPSKPTEVKEDFSKAKQPSQILVSTFYTSIEPYIRNIKEEDVGFMEYTGDEVEPYVMPKLGRHYLEVWEEQDSGVLPPVLLGDLPVAPPSSFAAPTPNWDPSKLDDPDLDNEEKGHGPLTERVISALLPIPDLTVWKGVKAAEDAMEGRPGGSGAAAARRERLNVTDLEARIRDTMRYHGLLDAVPNFTEKVDDPIATALREAQRELRKVVATNKARKTRLAAIARDRLGYQEYLELRDSIDKNITTLYAKLQKKDTPKLSKKKKKPLQGAAAAAAAAAAANAAKGSAAPEDPPSTLAPCPAALGLMPDEDNRLTVNEQLKQLIETRRQWVDTVGSIFDEKEMENPGRIYGLPKESIYFGIDEEVQAVLAAQAPNTSACTNSAINASNSRPSSTMNGMQNGAMNGFSRTNLSNGSHKGKERARSDAMDIG